MAIPALPLIAYLASSAYLLSRVIGLMPAIYQRVKRSVHPPKMQFSLKTPDKVVEGNEIYVYFIGVLFGVLAALGLMHMFVREWLLVIFVVLVLLSDEMRISTTETLLLEVMVFFDLLMAHNENNQDLFEILPKFILELQVGRVRKSVLVAILRWRSGESYESSLEAMRRIDPLLDEFVFTLQHSGWKNGPVLNIILQRLTGRAGRRWDRASWLLLIKDNYREYVQFCRSTFITALWVIVISNSSELNRVMPDRAAIVLAVLALLGLGFIFFLFFTRQWLRRSLLVSIFIIALTAYANSLIVSIPDWIQVETISHQSDSVRNTGLVTSQVSTHNQGAPVSFKPVSLNESMISRTLNPLLTPTPTSEANMFQNPPALISTSVVPQDFNLCCLRSSQPR